MSIRELNLTKEQHDWLNGWLELWGAWVYSGRLEKRMSSVIAKFMESVDINGACDQLRRWTYAGGKQWKGLMTRREIEREVCLWGQQ